MSEKGKLYQQINNIEEYHLGGIPSNEVIKVLDEAKKDIKKAYFFWVEDPKGFAKCSKEDLLNFFAIIEKWFGAP